MFCYDDKLIDEYPRNLDGGRRWRQFCDTCLKWEMNDRIAKELIWRCSHCFPETEKRRARRCGRQATALYCRVEGAGSAFEPRCRAHDEGDCGAAYERIPPEDFSAWHAAAQSTPRVDEAGVIR